jgi:ABC-2 type transport system ATP-binding protein
MTTASIIKLDNVSKRFVMNKHKSVKERIVNFGRAKAFREDFWALKDINLDFELGSTVGLVGHNGSGKSTLLKVIGGIIDPSTGTVQRRGRMAALLELGAGFHPDLTGRENVYLNAAILGLNQKEIDRYFDAIVDFSGIENFIDTQVKFYSSGMYVRLAFAVAVHVDPDLLLVDEVLAVGDEPFQRKCMDKILEFQREGRSIVVVSHSASQVGSLCDRVVVMEHGGMVFDGKPADGLRVLRFGYEEQRLAEQRASGEPEQAASSHITGIAVQSNDPIDRISVNPGDDVTIAFKYKLQDPSAPLAAGIAIETSTGQPVFGLNTKMLELAIPSDPGEHVVEFKLARQSLGGGQFIIRGSLEEVSGKSLDRLNPASSFQVVPPKVGAGIVRMDATGTVAQ